MKLTPAFKAHQTLAIPILLSKVFEKISGNDSEFAEDIWRIRRAIEIEGNEENDERQPD